MLRTNLLLILPLVVAVAYGQNGGIGYYGASNVRYQRPQYPQPLYRLRPLPLLGRPVLVNPPAVTTAPAVPVTQEAPVEPPAPVYAPIARPNLLRPIYSPGYRPIPSPRPLSPLLPPITASPPAQPQVAVSPELPVVTESQPPVVAIPQPSIAAAPQPPVGIAADLPVGIVASAPEPPVFVPISYILEPVNVSAETFQGEQEPELPPASTIPLPEQAAPNEITSEPTIATAPEFLPEPIAPILEVPNAAELTSPQLTPELQSAPVPLPVPAYQPVPVLHPTLAPLPVPAYQPVPAPLPVPTYQPAPVLEPAAVPLPIPASELRPAPAPQPALASLPVPAYQPAPVLVPAPAPVPVPALELQPTPAPLPVPASELQPTPSQWPAPAYRPEPDLQLVSAPQPAPISQPELVQQPQLIPEPVIIAEAEPVPLPIPVAQPELTLQPIYVPTAPIAPPVASTATGPQLGALPPLLPKPKPIRDPAFSWHTQPSLTQSTNYNPTTTATQVPPVVVTQPQPAVTGPTGYLKLDFSCKDGDGYYPVQNECDTYIECKGDRALKYSCLDGLHFNPEAKKFEYPCAYPSEVKCVEGAGKQSAKPTENCPNQYGFYSMNDGDCSKFIMCQEGLATIMDCPLGLVFNPQISSCDWPANVPQCNPRAFDGFTCPDPPQDEYGTVSDIMYKYRYNGQCKYYVACQRGHPRLLSCDRGLAFDEPSQSCINEDYVTNCAVPYTAI